MWDMLKTLVQRLAGQPRSGSDTPLERSLSKLSREQAETIRVLVERDEEKIRTRFGFLLASFGFRFVSAAWFPRGRYILLENERLRLAYVHREREVTSWFLADRSEREPIVNYDIEQVPGWHLISDLARDKIGAPWLPLTPAWQEIGDGISVDSVWPPEIYEKLHIIELQSYIPELKKLVEKYGRIDLIPRAGPN
jgi:hypothetical protein